MLDQVLKDHGRAIRDNILSRAVPRGECLVVSTKGPGGYPQITLRLDDSVLFMSTAHRAMWMAHHGRIEPRRVVMHLCDRKGCVNIRHLQLGTHADNMADMVAKGRQTRGSSCVQAKLSERTVGAARKAYRADQERAAREGVSRTGLMKKLADANGVTLTAMMYAIRGRTFKHVKEPPVTRKD